MIKNAIVACAGTTLSPEERYLFAHMQPWGIILFSRNIQNKAQIVALINDVKSAMGRDHLMVFIDQEGGRVSRLPSEHWRVPPSPTVFAKLYSRDPELAKQACFLNAQLTGLELKSLGINVNCAPMIDVPQDNSAAIISERALGHSHQQVTDLAIQIISGARSTGVASVIKHMPGHGRAVSDSHLTLPHVNASLDVLCASDFVPFIALNKHSMAMTAHIIFDQIDANLPATISPTIVNKVMRQDIGFNGLIMTDDINMNALSGNIGSRARQSIEAGCDMVLHCSGDLTEMQALNDAVITLTPAILKRVKAAEAEAFAPMPDISQSDVTAALNEVMAKAAKLI
ncbi:MAG: beta-N-acetylhexosaminidase [Glaciecola sp.]